MVDGMMDAIKKKMYRHLASIQRSANKKQVKEQLHSRKQTEHVKKLKT